MARVGSCEATELNANHRQVNPGFGTGFGTFIVPHQAPMAHEPAKGAIDNPTARPQRKTGGRVGALDDFYFQFRPVSVYPLAERVSSVAAIHPKPAQFGEPVPKAPENSCGH